MIPQYDLPKNITHVLVNNKMEQSVFSKFNIFTIVEKVKSQYNLEPWSSSYIRFII